MKIDHLQPDKKQLREFGLLFGAIFVGIFGLLLPWLKSSTWPLWPWIVGAITAGLGLVFPVALKGFYKLWMKFGAVMGFINTRIIMFIMFYIIVAPIGLIMGLFGKDPMRRKYDKSSQSYRIESENHDKSHMENPF
jgi:hypothetical protein